MRFSGTCRPVIVETFKLKKKSAFINMMQKSLILHKHSYLLPKGSKTIFHAGKNSCSSATRPAVMSGLDWKVHHHLAQLHKIVGKEK